MSETARSSKNLLKEITILPAILKHKNVSYRTLELILNSHTPLTSPQPSTDFGYDDTVKLMLMN